MKEVQRNKNGHILWTEDLKQFIVNNRQNISYIKRETGIKNQTISKKLNEWGYKERSSGSPRLYSLDEKVFDKIDNKEKAYWLGLLAADGSLNQNSTLIRLSLHKQDKETLINFNAFLKSNRPIFQSPNSRVCECCVNSAHMQESLIALGIGYSKSYNLKAPKIQDKFGKSFVLGLFDGDGCLSISKNGKYEAYAFSIVGTKDILEYALTFLFIYDNKYQITLANKCEKTYQLRVWGNYRVCELLKDLYSNNYNYPLKRKHDRFLRLLEKAPRKRNFSSKLS